ncbi:MAG: hypothetical protein C0505_02905 [Leptothrix sp. (in: Bacteria)]|nr:hypothetical protein [Leptothrix sp. (in: b-proteobacteria)]
MRLFDGWVRARQNRPPIQSTDSRKELRKIEIENFRTQLVEPRKRQLEELKEASASMSFADQVALLVMAELPSLETSTLLHRLSRQVAADRNAPYFSKENMADNCGCGCGCGCAAMADLSYQEKIVSHYQTKPYSIDPFNELKTPTKTRDALMATEFLESVAHLSASVTRRVNERYFQMGRDFGGS